MAKCPQCGASPVREGASCQHCGAFIEASAAEASTGTLTCVRCKSSNQADSTHCQKCGYLIYVLCSKCKSRVYVGAQRCGHCSAPQNTNRPLQVSEIEKEVIDLSNQKRFPECEALIESIPDEERTAFLQLYLVRIKRADLARVAGDVRFSDSYELKLSEIKKVLSSIQMRFPGTKEATEAAQLAEELIGRKINRDYKAVIAIASVVAVLITILVVVFAASC